MNWFPGYSQIFKWRIDMKRLLHVSIIFSCLFFISCATEQKKTQEPTVPQEKYDAPVWNVGDSWRFRYGFGVRLVYWG